MKKYLVTRTPVNFPSGETDIEDWAELPLNARVLTYMKVFDAAWDNGLTLEEAKAMCDELFGGEG